MAIINRLAVELIKTVKASGRTRHTEEEKSLTAATENRRWAMGDEVGVRVVFDSLWCDVGQCACGCLNPANGN